MKDQKKKIDLYEYEEQLYDQGYKLIAGCDEAGRGPLAGPCVVAACIMPPFMRVEGINDSKQLSAKKREELYKIIVKNAIAYNIVFISETEIDKVNIYQAAKEGMLQAINGLKVKPDYALIDAMPLPELEVKNEPLIHGDARCASIAAASILAKVTRDEYMEKMDVKYPNYGFKKHKGYCTKAHVEALEKYGPCKIHRKTFYPVTKYFSRQLSFDLGIDDDIEASDLEKDK